MFNWLQSLFKGPQPAGPPEEIAAFGVSDSLICETASVEGDSWRLIGTGTAESVRLFELPDPDVEQCMLTYRAKLKTKNVEGQVYLEMWCKMPVMGEFFSKGLQHILSGSNDWATYEVPFYLKAGQRPKLLKLNLQMGESGTVWIKDVQLFKTPLQ